MRLVKVGTAVLNQTPLDWERNKANILGAIASAREQGVSLLCLPEMCVCGYGCDDMYLTAGLRRTARKIVMDILPHTRGMVVTLGLPVMLRSGLFNTCCVAADGRIVGFVAKQNLCGDGIHYEPRWFKPWPPTVRDSIEFEGETYPIGDVAFSFNGIAVGFEICEDAWVATRPGREHARIGIDIILNPSASHFAFGKHDVRKRFVLEGSRAFGVTYVYANLLGNEAGRAIYDGGALIASGGELVAAGPRLIYDDYHVTGSVIDIDLTRMSRARLASFEPAIGTAASVVHVPFELPHAEMEAAGGAVPAWETSTRLKEEEFTRAVALGLFDYLRKSRSRGFVVSLSGGADSAAVVCLVSIMVKLACDRLGVEDFKRKLDYAKLRGGDVPSLVRELLTTAYQATDNSSDTTRNAARAVAEAINADHMELDVDALVDGYTALIEKHIGRPLTWEVDDIALQNIQARARGPSVWMLANLRNALLLATSNRSEAAVGYATMDGDTCGGLSPIAGIDKAFLRRWLRWMETDGPVGHGPFPALSAVNMQQPTAELRPGDAKQTDEDDLMPYDLLDAIEEIAIGQKRSPAEAYELLRVRFTQYAPEQLLIWLERFFRLWSRNQWKRERYAPAFHLDDLNLDPKTWCRFPILSGGFEHELRELRERIEEAGPEGAAPRETTPPVSRAGAV